MIIDSFHLSLPPHREHNSPLTPPGKAFLFSPCLREKKSIQDFRSSGERLSSSQPSLIPGIQADRGEVDSASVLGHKGTPSFLSGRESEEMGRGGKEVESSPDPATPPQPSPEQPSNMFSAITYHALLLPELRKNRFHSPLLSPEPEPVNRQPMMRAL
jgi:hypothetical protein